jgi:hypothetical protein
MKQRWQLAGVFVLALLFRVWMLIRLARTPLLDSLRSDSQVYWSWAALIRQQGWIGHNPFFLAPLYPYWLALMQPVVGPSVLGILLVQAVLGAAAAALLADAAARLTSPRVGLAIGLLVAGYESGILFDSLVLMESLLFALECLLLWLVVCWPWQSRLVLGAACAGALLGIAAYGRGTEVLLLLPLLLFLWRVAGSRGRALRASAAAAAIVALLSLPGMIRHRALVGEWIPYSYSGGMNLYIGNGPQASGTYSVIDFQDAGPLEGSGTEGGVGLDGRAGLLRAYGVRLSPAASSRYFTRLTLDAIRHDPLRWAEVMGVKLLMLFNLRDEPQVESLALHRALFWPLGWPIVGSFAMAALLGLLGLVWVRPSEVRWIFPLGYLAVTALGILSFFVVDRYRHHLVPALLLLGAATLHHVLRRDWLRGTSPVRIGSVALLAGALVFWPLPAKSPARLKWDLATRLGEAWLQKGRPDLALVQFNEAVAQDSGALEGAETPTGRTARALVFENRAIALWQLGRLDEAAQSLEQGIALDPQPGVALQKLFELHVLRGRMADAEAVMKRAGVSRPEAVGFLLDQARAEVRQGSGNELPYLKAVVALDPSNEVGSVALVRALVERGQTQEARAVLDGAERSRVDPQLIDAHRAWIAAREGKLDEAKAWLAKVPADRFRSDPRLSATLALIRASAPALSPP